MITDDDDIDEFHDIEPPKFDEDNDEDTIDLNDVIFDDEENNLE